MFLILPDLRILRFCSNFATRFERKLYTIIMEKRFYLAPRMRVLAIGGKEDVMQDIGFNTGSAQEAGPETPHWSKSDDWSEEEDNAPAHSSNAWED